MRVVEFYDSFRLTSSTGVHVCMVFEVLGSNLLKTLSRNHYRGMPLENVKSIIRQVSFF